MTTLAEILNTQDDESLIIQILEYTQQQGFEINTAPDILRHTIAVVTAQAVLDNGGLQYFLSSQLDGHLHHAEFVEAYRAIGAMTSADALQAAMDVLPEGVLHADYSERRAQLDRIFDSASDHSATLSDIEQQLVDQVENYTLAAQYIRQHRAELEKQD